MLAQRLAMVPSPPPVGERLAPETLQLLAEMPHGVDQVDELDTLIQALKECRIWDRLGTLSWARDAGDGLLLLWEPKA